MHSAALDFDLASLRPPPDVAAVEAPSENDPAPSLLEPWVLLGSQWAGAHATTASGEKRLLAAVLADAIRLYLKHAQSPTASGRLLFRETSTWVESHSNGWLLSYASICDVLGIDAERLRERLRSLAASGDHPAISFDAGRLRTGKGRKVRV